MSDTLEFYQNIAQGKTSAIAALAHLRESGLDALATLGFPTRRDEAWKYSVPTAWMKQRFVTSHNDIVATCIDDCPVGFKIRLVEGKVLLDSPLPKGVLVISLAEAYETHPALLKAHLGRLNKLTDGFAALNAAMAENGLLIHIDAGIILDEPLVIMHQAASNNAAHYLHHLVFCASGSVATVVEDYQGSEGARYFTNTITEVVLEADATLTHIKLQRESRASFHVGRAFAHQAENSTFNHHSLSLGGQWVRSDLDIRLSAPHAKCLMNGIYLPSDGQHIDHHTVVHHEVADCRSEQDYKGVLSGRARAVFDGKVIVAPNAVQTVAHQQNKNLLLSTESEVDTKPQLEIFADDVICSHGATVGQLSDEALFYLASRGIPTDEAKMLLISAFAADNLARIEHKGVLTWLRQLLIQQLELGHGCRAI